MRTDTLSLSPLLDAISAPNPQYKKSAVQRTQSLAIPLGSLGTLEDYMVQLQSIFGEQTIALEKRGVVVFCADHGVVAQGVSQVGSDVTTSVVLQLCQSETVMCTMAKCANATVIPVNMGMKYPISHPSLLDFSQGLGTADFSLAPAMSLNQAISSILAGSNVAYQLKKQGYQLLATGEMGIGNTTSATAMSCCLLGLSPEDYTGAGAGLSSEGIRHKATVIKESLLLHRPNPTEILEVLSAVGGFEIGGLIGFMLGCAAVQVPCIVDGLMGNIAALCAITLKPETKEYLIFSHCSSEPIALEILREMNINPLLHGNFRLGEGSGAVALIPLLDMAVAIYNQGITFSEMNIAPYVPLL